MTHKPSVPTYDGSPNVKSIASSKKWKTSDDFLNAVLTGVWRRNEYVLDKLADEGWLFRHDTVSGWPAILLEKDGEIGMIIRYRGAKIRAVAMKVHAGLRNFTEESSPVGDDTPIVVHQKKSTIESGDRVRGKTSQGTAVTSVDDILATLPPPTGDLLPF